jgi:iron complex outermembrane receptor protein
MAGMAFLLGGALASGGALAEVSEADFFDDLPVVLSPSRLSQPLADSPSSVTVIDRDMIRASGFTQVADVLRLVPGFSVAYSSSLLPTVTYHGLGDGYARRFQVLIDGRSVYSPDFGQVSWRNLPLALDDIERIEVIRGPAGASYGANAFMGVINILTRSGDYGAPYVEAGLGDHGQRLLNARVSGGARAFNWRLSAGTQLDDGLRKDETDDVHERFADWKSELQLDARQTLTLQAGIAHTRQETDFTPYNQHHGYANLGWKFAQNADSEFSAAYSLTEETFGDKPGIDLGYRTTRHNAGAQWQGSVSNVLRAALGSEYRRDSAQSDFYYSTPDTITEDSWRVYGSGEWKLDPQWLVNFGGMVERTHTGDNQFSPRLTLNYKPSREQSFRLEYNRAYRAPTFYELLAQNYYLDDGGTPDPGDDVVYQTLLAQNLQPERVTSRALGWLLQLPGQGLQVDARLFYDRYEDLIDVAFVSAGDGNDFIYQFVNQSDAATLQGVEFQIEWRPDPSTRIFLAPAWARIRSHDSSIEDSAPPFSFSLLLDRKIDSHWRASAGYYHSGAMTWLGGGSRVPVSDRLDARLAYQTRVNGKAAEFWLTGQSLLGGQTEFEEFQEAERRFLAGGRVEW